MFLYVKKYLFSFLGKLYIDVINIMVSLSVSIVFGISIILSQLFNNKVTMEFIVIIFGVCIISAAFGYVWAFRIGKNKVESINKDIEEKLEIMKNKKLLESKIKNSKIKIKNNNKKYL